MGINVFAVSRAIWDHDLFGDEKFSEREAWIWLLSEAAWKPTRVRVGKFLVNVGRGQLAHSVRFMADKWKWHASKVVRFLERLKTEGMIGTDATQGVSVVTICKYNEYQKVGLPEKTQTETVIGTAPEQLRNREETGETVKQENKNPSGREDAPVVGINPAGKSPDAMVYDLGKKILGKSSGGVITNLRKACEFDDVLATQILNEAAEKSDPAAWMAKRLRSVADGRAYRGVINAPSDGLPKLMTKEDREWADAERRIYAGVH